jgi:hypothetical protein
MQFASFDLRDPIFEVFGLRISLQVITLENVYGVARDRVEIRQEGDTAILRASGLTWAGQQERAPGEVQLSVTRQPTPLRIRVSARARAPEKIRCLKLRTTTNKRTGRKCPRAVRSWPTPRGCRPP